MRESRSYGPVGSWEATNRSTWNVPYIKIGYQLSKCGALNVLV